MNNFFIPKIDAFDIIEILIIILGIYYILKHIHKTRAWVFIKGMFVFFGIYLLAYMCGFHAITIIFEKSVFFFIIAGILILQPELRKLFESIGVKKMALSLKNLRNKESNAKRCSDKTVKELVEACEVLGKAKTGALIVLSRDIPLQDYIKSGIIIDAIVTKELLINTFEHNTPLHDGASIITGDRMVAATCYLPLSEQGNIDKSYGTRHRAAIGMAEVTDSFVIVVSEETGHISVAYLNKLYENLTKEDLIKLLYDFQKTGEEVKKQKLSTRITINLGLKILSVFIGVVAWLILINIYDPITTVSFGNLPITIKNETMILSQGQAYKVNGETTTAITVSDKRSIVENLTDEDIFVFADLERLTSIYTVSLTVSIPEAPDAKINFISNETIALSLEDIISKDFQLETVQSGSPMNGYFVNEFRANTQTITVSGPRSQINMIGKVSATIDVSGVSETFNTTITPIVYDVNGNVMDKVEVKPTNVYINVSIYKTKSVDLTLQVNTTNKMTYTVSDYTYSPLKIRIAAKDDVLDSMDELVMVVNLDVDESKISNGKYIADINLSDYISEDIKLVNPAQTATITLNVDTYVKKEMHLTIKDITVNNLSNDLSVVANFEDVSFNIWVPEEWADTITLEDINPKIDLDSFKAGSYKVPIAFVTDIVKFEGYITADITLVSK